MKYVRVTGIPDPERVPKLFTLLAGSPFVTEARLYDWNLSGGRATALLEVDGERDRFRDEAEDMLVIQSIDTTRVTESQFTLLLVIEPDDVPLLKNILETITREGIVVAKPIVYRDEQAQARIVGRAGVLQKTIADIPEELSIEISTIGEFSRSRTTPISQLSDRQMEVLLQAFDLGYYEHPRQTTHEEVAARLDCAPHTVSEHLQKAEIKIITDVLRMQFER